MATTINYSKHNSKVAAVVESVRARPAGMKISVRKPTPTHQIHNRDWKDKCHRVDVGALDEILGIREVQDRDDPSAKALVAVCESQVTMAQLAIYTLPKGLVAKCVPEYNDFTVAGLMNGNGIQTSCFRYGTFICTVNRFEVVLGNGEVKVCSPTENVELFHRLPESYGTLGIVTMAEVELVPAKSHVRSRYQLFTDVHKFSDTLSKLTRAREGDFLEGMVMAPGRYLITHSRFVTEAEAKKDNLPLYEPEPENINCGKMYYYQYLRNVVIGKRGPRRNWQALDLNDTLSRQEDYIPTRQFLFRSMRGAYWYMEACIACPLLTGHNVTRRMLDKVAAEQHSKTGFAGTRHLTREESQRCVVGQDMGIKLCRLAEGIEWVDKNLGVYPLWACPLYAPKHRNYKTSDEYLTEVNHPHMQPGDPENFWVVDIGVYGEPTVTPFKHHKAVKAMQEFVDCPSLWGVSYEDKAAIAARHDPIRRKYHAIDAFPGVEDKVAYAGNVDLEEESIPYWRFVDAYGWNWKYKVGSFLAGTYGLLFGLLYGALGLSACTTLLSLVALTYGAWKLILWGD